MKAFLTTVGEKTTSIVKAKLKKLGFEVVVLDGKEEWFDKYKKFLDMADEDCIRIDADVIPNDKLLLEIDDIPEGILMAQFSYFDFYRNEVGQGNPCYYTKEALRIIKDNISKIDNRRPEATAWRIKEINDHTWTGDRVSGMHGFGQDKETMERAKQNKIDRGQIELYDFDLAEQLMKL